ncbi:hypothetical protein [Enterococcus casseliflavus]|uniref:hypothetical protein n=1 Tax=Enterococcus casseliflavus TaxID=37734 RepID=UPI002953CADA|nr:hypothetical protein [Enterococcus casseliflavus]MDV7751727.1 hypothetical protein [Enterococcus casseliflavus]
MELKIDKLSFESETFEPFREQISEEASRKMEQIVEAIKKQYEFPRYMNKAQAAKYMNVSYNTMMQKYVPNGLKLIIVDGVVRISQDECDRFMQTYQK